MKRRRSLQPKLSSDTQDILFQFKEKFGRNPHSKYFAKDFSFSVFNPKNQFSANTLD
jgi:hypothetical protein